MATNTKSEKYKCSVGSMGAWIKDDESSTGHIWTAGFHYIKLIFAWHTVCYSLFFHGMHLIISPFKSL